RSGRAPSAVREARTVLATAGHVVRRRCPTAIVSLAHNAGRLIEAVAAIGRPPRSGAGPPDDFLSGTPGPGLGLRATRRAVGADLVCDLSAVATAQRPRLARAARRSPRRRVLALAVERDDVPNVLPAARAELQASHHDVRVESITAGGRGKFENLDL